MNIVERSREFTKVEEYLLTLNRAMISVKDIDDETVIPVKDYCIYNDINAKGEEVVILTILTPDNMVYCTQSETFKRSFHDIFNIMDGNPFSIKKVSGTTKAGRPYVDCVLELSSVS